MLSNSADFILAKCQQKKMKIRKFRENLKRLKKKMRFVSSLCSDLIWDFWIKWKIPKKATFVVSKITCFRPEENLVNISYPISFKVHFYIYELDAFNLTTTISIFLVRKKKPSIFEGLSGGQYFFSVSVLSTYLYKKYFFIGIVFWFRKLSTTTMSSILLHKGLAVLHLNRRD